MIYTERLGASEYRHRGDKSVHGHVPVNINMELTKAPGRTTDTMDATVNGVLSDAWMTCPLLKYDVAFETREYACIATGSSTTPLSEGGDSGSLFVEGTMHAKLSPRQVAGLLFGGGLRPKQKLNSNVPPRDMAGFEVTFMTPATRLLQWLKEDTGMDLEFGDGSWTL